MRRVSLILALFAFGLVALAQQRTDKSLSDVNGWVFIGSTRSGDRVYYNKERLTDKPGGVKETWAKFYSKPMNRKAPYYVFYQMDVNCASRQTRAFFYIEYRKNGTTIREVSQPDAAWAAAIPGSAADMIVSRACKLVP